MMSSDTRTWDTGGGKSSKKELRALSPVRRLMRRLNLEALVYESAPFPVLLRKLSALIPACLLWWVIYEPHRLASLHQSPRGALTLLHCSPEPGVTRLRGAYGGLPELPGVLVRWVLCIAAMVAVVHLCGVRRRVELHHSSRCAFTVDCADAGSGHFSVLCAGRLIEYMMTPLTLMFETVYAGPTAVYSGDGMIPLHLFLSRR